MKKQQSITERLRDIVKKKILPWSSLKLDLLDVFQELQVATDMKGITINHMMMSKILN